MKKNHRTQFGIVIVVGTLGFCGAVRGGSISWDGGGGGNQNWSASANWNPDGSASGNDVTFTNVAASGTQGTVTTIVDSNVSIGGLLLRNTTGNYHTIQINPGVTLTVNGTTGFEIDPLVNPAQDYTSLWESIATITGGGAFVVNNANANFNVGSPTVGAFVNTTHVGVLDLSGLANFQANVNNFNVGNVNVFGTGVLVLGATNTITANTVRLGGWGNRRGTGLVQTPGEIDLGQVNQINTDNLNLGMYSNEGRGQILMRAGLVNPTVTIRAKNGTGRAALQMAIGAAGAGDVLATIDLSGATVDALFSTVVMGLGRALSAGAFDPATFTFNKGVIDAQTITLGQSPVGADSNVSGNIGRGTFNIQGSGTLIADTIYLGDVSGNGTVSSAEGILNLQDTATLQATTIDKGPGTGAGGFVRQLNWAGGTIQNKAGTDLTITAAIPVTLTNTATHTFNADAGHTITVNGAVQNSGGTSGGGITKVGAGRLIFAANNTYTGPTAVNAGTLLVNANWTAAGGAITVSNGGVLGGSGTITGAGRTVTVAGGGTLAPGNSPGVLTLGTLALQSGAVYDWGLGASATDRVDVVSSGGLSFGATATLRLSADAGALAATNDTFVLFTFTGTAPTNPTWTFVPTGRWVTDANTQVSIFGSQVLLTGAELIPEPSTVLLFGLGGWLLARRSGWSRAGGVARRRRRGTNVTEL